MGKIDASIVVDAAFAVLEEAGLKGLSMRAVGRRLGINGSALYWHVKDRAELEERMAIGLYDAAEAMVPGTLAWPDWLHQFGRDLRAILLRHRDSALLLASARGLEERTRKASQRLVEPLTARGMPDGEALVMLASVASLVVGWVLHQQNGNLRHSLSQLFDFDAAFEASLAAMIAGLVSQERREGKE